jgi:hypothetical protein
VTSKCVGRPLLLGCAVNCSDPTKDDEKYANPKVLSKIIGQLVCYSISLYPQVHKKCPVAMNEAAKPSSKFYVNEVRDVSEFFLIFFSTSCGRDHLSLSYKIKQQQK